MSDAPRIQTRILPHQVADGPTLMATDEALLEAVAAGEPVAYVRTYEWIRPTLSLGYFQESKKYRSDPRWEGVEIVRRATGGGAIWHDRDVTYAIVVPGDHPWTRPNRELYRRIHGAIAGSIREWGAGIDRQGVGFKADAASKPFLCFADRDDEDLVVGDWKVVGSAQRRRDGAVLQHGSLLLATSERTPELPGLAELSGREVDATSWAERIRRAIADALGLPAIESDWPGAVTGRARQLREDVYRSPEWTDRR